MSRSPHPETRPDRLPTEVLRPVQRDVDAVVALALGTSLSAEEAAVVRQMTTTVTVAAGEVLLRQGRHARCGFLLAVGSAAADGPAGTRLVLSPGAAVGMAQLVAGHPSAWTVVALTDLQVLVVSRASLEVLRRRVPAVAERLLGRSVHAAGAPAGREA